MDSALASPASLTNAAATCFASGWSTTPWPQDAPLDLLALELRACVAERRELSPRRQAEAQPGTLSSRYGLEAFPWHTDAAHQARPPRLLLMRALSPTTVPTLTIDVQELLKGDSALRHGLCTGAWTVRGGGTAFYAPALESRGRLRFNPAVMTPVCLRAQAAATTLEARLDAAEPYEHSWSGDQVLLLDNCRMLHARPALAGADRNRLLERILCDPSDCLGR